ncbi:hypothetical protein B0H19DRAFT_1322493 [Mycena capillaripes]|nr:hypothetical protein B0H19DRAFT_1322493 [Mycena capillaripes]
MENRGFPADRKELLPMPQDQIQIRSFSADIPLDEPRASKMGRVISHVREEREARTSTTARPAPQILLEDQAIKSPDGLVYLVVKGTDRRRDSEEIEISPLSSAPHPWREAIVVSWEADIKRDPLEESVAESTASPWPTSSRSVSPLGSRRLAAPESDRSVIQPRSVLEVLHESDQLSNLRVGWSSLILEVIRRVGFGILLFNVPLTRLKNSHILKRLWFLRFGSSWTSAIILAYLCPDVRPLDPSSSSVFPTTIGDLSPGFSCHSFAQLALDLRGATQATCPGFMYAGVL